MLRFFDLELDPVAFELRRDGRRVAVEPRVLDLIVYCARNPGRLLLREELLNAVWQGRPVSDWALARAVRHARRVLGDDAGARPGTILETVRGRGFRWCVPPEPVPRPAVSIHDPYVGRAGLFAQLDRMLEALRTREAHHGALVLVGPAGIGKTRALEELAAHAQARGCAAWSARCPESGGAAPFFPWAQLLRAARIERHARWLSADAARAFDEAMPELALPLAAASGAARSATASGLGAAAARFRLAAHLRAILRRISGGLALLCFDDVDRADAASLALLHDLAAEPDSGLALLLTCRPPGDDRSTPLARLPGATGVTLPGLDLDGVRRLTTAAWGAERAQAMAAPLLERTGGNPFFLRQVLAAGSRDALPGGVRSAIQEQLQGLPAPARTLLRQAALQGRDFALTILARAAATTVAAVEAELAPAQARGIVHEQAAGIAWRFDHTLIREVLADEFAPAALRAEHGRIADALQADGAPWARIASHRLAAAGSDPARVRAAVDACVRAADAAGASHAHAEAVRHCSLGLSRAGAVAPDAALRLRLLVTLGRAQIGNNQVAEGRATLLEATTLARAVGNRVALAQAALAYAGREETPYLDELRVRRLDEALQRLPRRDSPLRAQVSARLAEALCLHPDARRRTRLAQAAVAMGTRLGDPLSCCLAQRGLHLAGSFGANVRARLAVARAELAAALDVGDPILIRDARSDGIGDLLDLGERAALDTELARFGRLARQVPEPLLLWFDAHYGAMLHLLTGELAQAVPAMARGQALGAATGYELAEQWHAMQRHQYHRDAGTPERFDADLARLAAQNPETPWALAALLRGCELGDRSGVLPALRTLVQGRRLHLPENFLWRYTACLLAELACAVGDTDSIGCLRRMLAPHAGLQRAIYGLVWAGPVDLTLARLAAAAGDWVEARRCSTRALAQSRRLKARLGQADALETRAMAAEMLGRRREAAADRTAGAALRA